MRSIPLPRLFVALLATFWICTTATAEPSGDTTSSKASTTASEAAAASPDPDGLRIYRDPETGAWVDAPSPEQEAALSDKIHGDRFDRDPTYRSSEGLVPFPLAGGGRGVFLAGRFTSSLWVHRHADGSLHLSCDSADPQDRLDSADPEDRLVSADAGHRHSPTETIEPDTPTIPTDDQGNPLQ